MVELIPFFFIVFYWTPPHFWALAIRYKDDYEAAGVPMLPAVVGIEATTRRMLLYTGLMVGVSMMLVPQWQYELASLIPEVRVVEIVGARHELVWTHPDRVLDELAAFLG